MHSLGTPGGRGRVGSHARNRGVRGRPPRLPASMYDRTTFFHFLDLYRSAPESGDLQCKSRRLKRQFGPTPRAGGTVVYLADCLAAQRQCNQQPAETQRIAIFYFLDSYRSAPESGVNVRPRFLPPPCPPTLRVGSNRIFQVIGLYCRSPESSDLW